MAQPVGGSGPPKLQTLATPFAPSTMGSASASAFGQTQTTATRLPRVHLCAYKGDTLGLLDCITDNCSLHETITLKNQHSKLVCGITPLFLAAQRGHLEACKLLCDNGANPLQPCYISGTAELCTPQQVASLNLHLKVSRYLKRAAAHRRKEEAVLALDEEDDRTSIASKAMSVRSVVSKLGAALLPRSLSGGLGRRSRSLAAFNDQLAPEGGQAADAAAATFMQEVDLADFDPDSGAVGRSDGGKVRKFFSMLGFSRKDKKQSASGFKPPISSQGSDKAKSVAGSAAGGPQDTSKVLDRFLKDLDLASWRPDEDTHQAAVRSYGSVAAPVIPAHATTAQHATANGGSGNGAAANGGGLAPAGGSILAQPAGGEAELAELAAGSSLRTRVSTKKA